jgi:hypothetical protein
VQALENAGLIVARTRGGAASLLKATRLGEDALAEGKVSAVPVANTPEKLAKLLAERR